MIWLGIMIGVIAGGLVVAGVALYFITVLAGGLQRRR